MDMNSAHKAVITHIEIPMHHRTQQIPRPARNTAKKQIRSGGNKLNWDEHMIHTYETHQEQDFITTNPNTTTKEEKRPTREESSMR